MMSDSSSGRDADVFRAAETLPSLIIVRKRNIASSLCLKQKRKHVKKLQTTDFFQREKKTSYFRWRNGASPRRRKEANASRCS